MITKLYTNGCSWTDGDTLVVNGLFDKLNIKDSGKNYSYPKLISEYYRFELIDESRYGGSLNRIIRKTWRYIEKQMDLRETLFLFEIPNGMRDEIFCVDSNDYLNVTPSDLDITDDIGHKNVYWKKYRKDIINYYEKFWNHDEFIFKQWINFMNLIMYIKQYTEHIYLINYYEFMALAPFVSFKKNLINEENLIKLIHPQTNNFYNQIEELCFHEKMSIGDVLGHKDTHPNIEGHKIIFEIVKKHFDKIEYVSELKNIIDERNSL